MFKIPEKQIIVNSDDQIKLLDGPLSTDLYDASSNPANGIIMEGFLPRITSADVPNFTANLNGISRAVKMQKEASTAAVAHQFDYTVTATSADEGDVFRLVFKSVDGAPTDFQNDPVSKIYQLPLGAGLGSAILIATAMESAINADPDALVTVSRTDAVLTLTAKETGIEFDVRIDSELSKITGTVSNKTQAARGIHTYDHLKNIEWSKNLDFDRNQQWQPLKGETYTMYKFYVNSTGFVSEGNNVPNAAAPTAQTAFKLWVSDNATTFKAAIDFLFEDLNALT